MLENNSNLVAVVVFLLSPIKTILRSRLVLLIIFAYFINDSLGPLSAEADRRRIPRMGYAHNVFAFFVLKWQIRPHFLTLLITIGGLPRAVLGIEAGPWQ